ncbi:MAG: GspB domain-containing protein [Glaciimonas sp.]|nr:GspB domain-containing protein [Glaciimonas sp.]
MSYILDALKKAEAQRTLGALPNIHAQAVLAATSDDRTLLWLRAGRWGALTAIVLMLVALAWFRPWQRGAVLPEAAPSVPPQSAAPAASVAPAVSPPVRAAPSMPEAVPPEASKPKAAAGSMPASRPKQAPAVAITPAAKKLAPAPAPLADAADPELQTLRELPPQIQMKIPPLVISGYIYSSNQAERSLLINNQLLREGDTVAPGLILEKMLRGAVVLNYQGYRYRMPY